MIMSNSQNQQSAMKKLPAMKRNRISLSQAELVKTGLLNTDSQLPLVIQPAVEGTLLSDWARANHDLLTSGLHKHGGILFRGFAINTGVEFEQFVKAVSVRPMRYIEGATPRTQLTNLTYTSTEYPPDQSIALHNELSYVTTWPMRIWFFCLQPAEERGETPIADVRKVYQRINPHIRERFIKKGWMLTRNYGDDISLSWSSVFGTDDRGRVEEYCRASEIEFEWKGERRLLTRQTRPAIARHPQTQEIVWFNHIAFWHNSSLEPEVRAAMLSVFKIEDLPYNTYYGDGSPIEDSIVEEIREAYRQETVAFPWLRGDVLMLDNMLVAHGRNPFKGARKVLVSMGEPNSERGV
jgi:alpha-ketoglutarate-dependent taurine dioxygenase